MSDFRRRMRPALGTYVEIGVPAAVPQADTWIDRAFAEIDSVQTLLNRHDSKSELSLLNRKGRAVMSKKSAVLLRLARNLMWSSGRLFDCAVGSPREAEMEDISIQGLEVKLGSSIQLTLDGVAKGYAVDLAVKSLKRTGVPCGWVNAGGDLRVFGDLALPIWRREISGTFSLAGHLKNGAVASSMVSKFNDVSFTGQIAHGSGALPELGVWSVLAPSAWLADALTKVASLAARGERDSLIERLGGKIIPGDCHSIEVA